MKLQCWIFTDRLDDALRQCYALAEIITLRLIVNRTMVERSDVAMVGREANGRSRTIHSSPHHHRHDLNHRPQAISPSEQAKATLHNFASTWHT